MAEWFDPEALEATQSEVHKTAIGDMDTAGGFGSYAVANRGAGLAASRAGSHNLLFASQRVAQYAAVLGGRTFERIADIGCGLGITTDALSRHYPQAEVVGLEISTDGIEYAQKNFKRAQFIRTAVAPTVPLPGSFDLILCQEFYPFTRTSDRETHRSYIEHLLNYLRPNGVLLIELSERDRNESILATINGLGFAAQIRGLPFDRVYRYLPLFTPALVASKILSVVMSQAANKCVVIRKSA